MTTRNKIISEFKMLQEMFKDKPQGASPFAWKVVERALQRTKDPKQAYMAYRAFRHSLGANTV